MSLDRLIEGIKTLKSPIVAGLDPKLEYIPDFIINQTQVGGVTTFESAAEAIFEFNRRLIDSLCGIVPAIKPQCAYYELYGWQGMRALKRTIDYAKQKGMFVVTDGKRNDIDSTMEAYAQAHLGVTSRLGEAFGGDALTVNGYLGSDGIRPLLRVCAECDKGIFILVKTSNKSSGELQDKRLETGETIFEAMGKMCRGWGKELPGKTGYTGVGAVVGATYPEQLTALRQELPETFFLVPGYGAQGGGAANVAGAFDPQGGGAIINSSRAIMCAWKKEGCDPEDFAGAAQREAQRMREEIFEFL
ncbi:MAG: orotidine-5'-phosphate decarboxylase [Oscillospiraceae bacterium]|jgi:orotidine-5'-phosphate decarboxylase|nr:orotidine-5'-phosphate decarboxylase [Oscillospiraceae bacterium]